MTLISCSFQLPLRYIIYIIQLSPVPTEHILSWYKFQVWLTLLAEQQAVQPLQVSSPYHTGYISESRKDALSKFYFKSSCDVALGAITSQNWPQDVLAFLSPQSTVFLVVCVIKISIIPLLLFHVRMPKWWVIYNSTRQRTWASFLYLCYVWEISKQYCLNHNKLHK